MNADRKALADLIDRWHVATGEGDVETVLSLMEEDAIFLIAGKPALQGRAAFEKGLRALLETHSIRSSAEIQEVQSDGGMAYCRSLLTVHVTSLADQLTVERLGSALSIFRKQADGRWLLSRDANLLPPL
jgi:uncharacterized protein (TIGR02246 family)